MNINYQDYIPADFGDSSKVWVYQSNRLFTIGEALEIEEMLNDFITSWNSHGLPVKGYANMLFGQFIVIMADETQSELGGCGVDDSIHTIQEIEKRFKVSMFDRQSLAFIIKGKVERLPYSQFNYAMLNGFITPYTEYFNNLVSTKEDFLHNWLVPVKDSWLAAKIDGHREKV